jgi:Cu+-exporting ATPase
MSPTHPQTDHRDPTDDDLSELEGGPDTGSADVDPVCGMTVTLKPDTRSETFDGKTYHFCSEKCQATFKADPPSYTTCPPDQPVNTAPAAVQYT